MAQTDVPTTALDTHRAEYADLLTDPLPADATTRPTSLGGVDALRLVVDGVEAAGTLLYLHGGGYAVGSARTGVRFALPLARRARLDSYLVEYRLAPEHRFPRALDDACAAYQALLEDNVDPTTLVVAGDSAGGALAIATLAAARDAGWPQPAAAVAFSPFADLTLSGESIDSKRSVDPIFERADLQTYADYYIDRNHAAHPLASPVYASLAGLPPLLIQAGSHELLLDDAVRLARRAAADDVDVTLNVTSGETHCFQLAVGQSDSAEAAIDRAADFLRQHLTRVEP